MRTIDYCPCCRGKGEVLTDSGYVPCPADALRAHHTAQERPVVIEGYVDPSGEHEGEWADEIDLAKAYRDAYGDEPLAPWQAEGR